MAPDIFDLRLWFAMEFRLRGSYLITAKSLSLAQVTRLSDAAAVRRKCWAILYSTLFVEDRYMRCLRAGQRISLKSARKTATYSP